MEFYFSNFSLRIYYYFLNLSFQPSPWCFTLCIIFTSTLGNLPKFFEFFLIYDGDESVPDFWTTNLSEDPRYIRSSSYNELIITGIFPLLALCYYNYEIYARIRLSCFIELGRYVGGKYNWISSLSSKIVKTKFCMKVGELYWEIWQRVLHMFRY